MKTSIALLIKFAATFLASWISYSVFDNIFLTIILIIAASVTVLDYLIGDLIILPRFGNVAASITNGVMSAATSYIILLTTNYDGRYSIFLFAVMVTIVEVFFHMYLFKMNMIRNKSTRSGIAGKPKLNYSTEIAKEMNPDSNFWKFNKKK